MKELGPAPDALTPEEILTHTNSLDELVKAAVDPMYDMERQIQINKARRNWQMVKGNHYSFPDIVATPYGDIADFITQNVPAVGDETGADIKFCSPYNFIGGDLYKFMAVMGQSAPRVKAVADNPADAQGLSHAQNADTVVRDLWERWKADQKQRVLAFHQYTTGPCFMRTPWVLDGRKYGRTVEPKITMQTDEHGNVFPAEDEPSQYDNGDVELHLYSILEVSVAYMAKTLDETWLICEVMKPKWELLGYFPEKLEQYRNSDPPDDDVRASSLAATEAREAVSNPSAVGRTRRSDMWRWREFWFPPYLYEAISDKTFRDQIKSQYSDGFYLAKVGSVPVKCDHRKLTDEWAVCKTGRGEKIMDDPIANDSVPIQRSLNDLLNMALETVLRAISQTIIDATLIDREAMSKKEPTPGEFILTAIPTNRSIDEMIKTITPAHVSDQLAPLVEKLRQSMQDITGIRPELSGGGQTTQTYREAKQRKDQALMQLSPQAQEMQYAWEKVGDNGVKQRARYGSGTVTSTREGSFGIEVDVVDMADLVDNGWHCEADDNFPMSTADMFDKLWGLLKEFPPEVQQALSILDPMNSERTLELLQIPGYESVGEDQKKKTLADVEQLLQGQPMPGQPGPDGQPGPPQPSIPPDPFDDHGFVASFLPKWMNSKTGRQWRQKSPQGFENVVAFWQAHSAMAQPPGPPPQPPVKAGLNVSVKGEMLPPDVLNDVMTSAGIQVPPAPPQQPPAGALPPLGQAAGGPAPPPAKISDLESPEPVLEGPQPAPQFLQ